MGLKAVINRHKDNIRMIEGGSEEVLIDIDTRDDFRKRLHLLKKES